MVIALQPSLLDLAVAPRFAPLAERISRRALAGGAWVDHCAGWLGGADALVDELVTTIDWRAEQRRMYDRVVAVPRLVAWFGSGAPLPVAVLAEARRRLSDHYATELGEPFTSAGLCYYRDGRDSVAWHGDTIGRGAREDTMVAIVSFGTARTLALRPRGGGVGVRYLLGHGDLLVMGGSCQRTWEHAVLKATGAVGARISVQFRPAGVS